MLFGDDEGGGDRCATGRVTLGSPEASWLSGRHGLAQDGPAQACELARHGPELALARDKNEVPDQGRSRKGVTQQAGIVDRCFLHTKRRGDGPTKASRDRCRDTVRGGYLIPEACVAAQLAGAARSGATIRTNVEVDTIAQETGQVRVVTPDGPIIADRVVVSAGAWNAPLLGAPFDRLLRVSRQVLYWCELDDLSAYRPDAPVFIWMYGKTDLDYVYGFPPLPGDTRIKVAREQYRRTTTAAAVDRRVDPGEPERMYHESVEGRLAGATPRVAGTAVCLYTMTPDRNFIIDQHPMQDRVTVVSACSGHGFKHSAGIGAALAAHITDGRSERDFAPFSLSRFL